MHRPSPPDIHWSTDNVGEAAPGVLSPLGSWLWSNIGELSTRASFVGIGGIPGKEAKAPEDPMDKVVGIFCGRLALQVELLTRLGDSLPGATGEDIAASLFG